MTLDGFSRRLALCPIIPAVREELFPDALRSPAEAVFLLEATVTDVDAHIRAAHEAGKGIFIHMDLTHGIGKDPCGVAFLADLGADGIISTRAALIKSAREAGILAIQRCFAVDSWGLASIREMISAAKPDCVEIMPGVISKVIAQFAGEPVPVIASGLIASKAEVTSALGAGAAAVSTGKQALWAL